MKVKINGQETEIDSGMSVLSLLEEKGVNPSAVVVEYNFDIPDREKLGRIKLNEGDIIEIIKFIGGG